MSGDNPVSVGAVAGSLGCAGDTIDARQLPEEPDQLADTLEGYTRSAGYGPSRSAPW